MSALQDAARMLERAEQAAVASDFESAEQLLRGAARIQEAELGPLHPDLANTLNNLAIVAERTGRLGDAETFYRRAVAIAAASLPADHPMRAASRENLEAFCRARGLPVETPVATTLSPAGAAIESAVAAVQKEPVAAGAAPVSPATSTKIDAPRKFDSPRKTDSPRKVDSPRKINSVASDATPRPDARPAMPARSVPVPPAAPGVPRALVGVVIGVIAAIVALLLWRPWSPREAPPPAVVAPPAGDPARPPVAEPPARAAPGEPAPPAAIAPRSDARETPANQRAAPSRTSEVVTLPTAELCQTFSTGGDAWRCDPAAAQVSPGPLVLYTRVRSASDGVVVHRWYRGDALQQSVKLTTLANQGPGYRTYSRQTVDGGEWRVEVRSATGDLLHERRVVVR
jgi:hypothetical protein